MMNEAKVTINRKKQLHLGIKHVKYIIFFFNMYSK